MAHTIQTWQTQGDPEGLSWDSLSWGSSRTTTRVYWSTVWERGIERHIFHDMEKV